MKKLLNHHKLKLLYTRNKLVLKDSSQTGWNLSLWRVTGGAEAWHIMTTDTNEDKSTGLSGGIAMQCVGSYGAGSMEREIELKEYGEILFEHYVKNEKEGEESEDNSGNQSNFLRFYIDGVVKLEIEGPSPWQRCIPIGLTPGKHKVKFEYIFDGEPNGKKGVIDTVTVWEGLGVDCLITEFTPPKPLRSINNGKILRGFTRYQEMTVADTEIKFTAYFDGLGFLEFMQKSDEAFYFIDEFGLCYRGIFPETINPKSIAMNEVYAVELEMVAGQKTGKGFC